MIDFPTIDDSDFFADTEPSRLHQFLDTDFKNPQVFTPIEKVENPFFVIAREYPRIHAQITYLWGTQELQNRFTRWLLTDQEGRKGWPKPVYDALMEVANRHSIAFDLASTPKWGDPPDRW